MTLHTWLVYGLGFILVWALCLTQVNGLQCYGCNIIQGQRYVDVGCSNPEVITCAHSHKGFKHRFCIKTESSTKCTICQRLGFSTVKTHPVECAFKISKCLPHYTLAEFAALGIVLTSGCATSRHCQQQELPGVRIHCCDSDLCNSATSWYPVTLHYISALFSLLLLRMWL